MVFITSMKGTAAWTARKRSGRSLVTAPIRRPPALPPSMSRRSGEVHFSRTRNSAQSMKSKKVFFFFMSMPSSCHASPISSPPRMWAIAKGMPRSRRLRRRLSKVADVPAP